MYGYAEEGIRTVDDMGIVAARVDNARILNNIDTVDGRLLMRSLIRYQVCPGGF